ncbi:zinc transporter ZupT [Fidelibacter multiformis]|uniref:zinc transporter ZupT n=1 Tax=Fidelibacter multiformis TaxID=3377529 RepID=UPI0037DCCCFE
MDNFWLAFGLTLIAGMATGIGSVIAFTAKRTNYRFLSISTGFSAGVMLYVSFVEIFYKGFDALGEAYGENLGSWVNTAAFFSGIFLIALIDNLIPSIENPHEPFDERATAPLHDPNAELPDLKEVTRGGVDEETPDHIHHIHHTHLLRLGLFTALAITIHNFPEGLATFLSGLKDPQLAVAITVAIALHNIPEGISVSVPIFYATGNRKKAFFYSFMSGLAEPVGAVIAYVGIRFFLAGDSGEIPSQIMGILFAAVAGIMVYISLDQLLPTSRAYGKGHDSLLGLMGGMIVMALSLLLMN